MFGVGCVVVVGECDGLFEYVVLCGCGMWCVYV